MLYMVVKGDETKAKRNAHIGFVLVRMFWAYLAGDMVVQECLGRCEDEDMVDVHWDDHSGKVGYV